MGSSATPALASLRNGRTPSAHGLPRLARTASARAPLPSRRPCRRSNRRRRPLAWLPSLAPTLAPRLALQCLLLTLRRSSLRAVVQLSLARPPLARRQHPQRPSAPFHSGARALQLHVAQPLPPLWQRQWHPSAQPPRRQRRSQVPTKGAPGRGGALRLTQRRRRMLNQRSADRPLSSDRPSAAALSTTSKAPASRSGRAPSAHGLAQPA